MLSLHCEWQQEKESQKGNISHTAHIEQTVVRFGYRREFDTASKAFPVADDRKQRVNLLFHFITDDFYLDNFLFYQRINYAQKIGKHSAFALLMLFGIF